MLKLIGVYTLCAAATVGGLYLSAKQKKAQKLRAEFIRLIEQIESGISHGALPLSDIYAAFHAPTLEHAGFCAVLRERDFADALDTVLPMLDADSAAALTELAETLGRSAMAGAEADRCERVRQTLYAADKARRAGEDTRAALFARLGLMASLAAALALL